MPSPLRATPLQPYLLLHRGRKSKVFIFGVAMTSIRQGGLRPIQFTEVSSESNLTLSIHSRCHWPRFATPLSNDTGSQTFLRETCTYFGASIVISLRAWHANASAHKMQTKQNKKMNHTPEIATFQCEQVFGKLIFPARLHYSAPLL